MVKAPEALIDRIKELEHQLEEAKDTIEAIRTGQIDALVVNNGTDHTLYTLKSADHSYRLFIEQMAEGAVTLNTSGLILHCNSKFATMVKRPLAKVIGHTFIEFVANDSKPDFQNTFINGWTEDIKNEIFLSSAGKDMPVKLSVNALLIDQQPSLNIIVTDLTIQKEAERELRYKNEQLVALNEALENSNHDLQQFASVASHDLQEPLRKIQVFSKFLKDKGYEELSEASKQYLEKIIESSTRMKTLIVDILTYSRLSAEDPTLETVDIYTLFAEILDDFDLKISEKNAVVELGPLPSIEGNKGQLRQVFTNLINNALKFTRPNVPPRITIQSKKLDAKDIGLSLSDDKRYCRISIKDNGIGFDEKYASSIFSLFEKLNPKSLFEGSGIGLAIAKKIIDKHHGIIIAKSKEGGGSEFNIILPFKRVDNYGG